MAEKVYADGLFIKKKENIDWEEYTVSVKVEEFKRFLDTHANEKGYVNLLMKNSQAGGKYFELDTWKPTPKADAPVAQETADEIPFN